MDDAPAFAVEEERAALIAHTILFDSSCLPATLFLAVPILSAVVLSVTAACADLLQVPVPVTGAVRPVLASYSLEYKSSRNPRQCSSLLELRS